jgi:hypothetical protein
LWRKDVIARLARAQETASNARVRAKYPTRCLPSSQLGWERLKNSPANDVREMESVSAVAVKVISLSINFGGTIKLMEGSSNV